MIIIGGRILQILIMLVSIRILTTLLSPEEVGNYYLALTILAFFNLILLNPPGMYFGRHLLHWQRSQNLLNALFVFIFWMIIVAVLSIPIIIILFSSMDYSDKYSLEVFILFIILAVIISTTHRNVMYGSNTLGYRKEFVIFLIITLLLGLIFSSGLAYFYSASSLSWLFGVIIAESLMLYFIFRFFIQGNKLNMKKIKQTITKERVTIVLKFAIPIGITTFLMWGQNMSYRFIVDYKYSAEVFGYIAIGLGISSAVFSSLEAISMQYFNPIFLKNILDATKEQRGKAWNKMASLVVPIYLLATVFTVAMSEVLITILVDSQFHEAYIYAMIGAIFEFFRVMTNLLNNVAQSEHQTSYTIKPYLVGFIVSVGVLMVFDFKDQVFMVPVVLSVAYALVFGLMYFNMKKLLDIKITVDLLKITVLSLPFGLVYFVDLNTNSIFIALLLSAVFGSYLLFSIWFLIKQKKGVKI